MSPEQRSRMEANRIAALQRRDQLQAMARQGLVRYRPERRHADPGIPITGSRAVERQRRLQARLVPGLQILARLFNVLKYMLCLL